MTTIVPGAFGASVQAAAVGGDGRISISQGTVDDEVSGAESSSSSSSREQRDDDVAALARSFTQRSIRHPEGDHINPFFDNENPLLNPASQSFNARAWTKTLIGISSRDPERYPQRVAGISYTKLNVHGFGVPTDYQKTFGNLPLEAIGLAKRLVGSSQKTKIQILKDFDGLVRSGEMLVVLGRPGR